MAKIIWVLVAIVGAIATGGIALHRGESINALWLVVAAGCIYAIGYRFYSAWIATKVLIADPARPLDRLRSPLRGDCGPGAFDRSHAGSAVRLSAGHALDFGGRCVGRLRAGHVCAHAVHATQWP
jgi:hypothetical protein